jgi:hypothetical protein
VTLAAKARTRHAALAGKATAPVTVIIIGKEVVFPIIQPSIVEIEFV